MKSLAQCIKERFLEIFSCLMFFRGELLENIRFGVLAGQDVFR